MNVILACVDYAGRNDLEGNHEDSGNSIDFQNKWKE